MGEADRGVPLELALGPSHSYKAVTLLAGIAVVVGIVVFVERIVSGTWQSVAGALTLALPVLVFAGFLRFWIRRSYYFDDAFGILVVTLRGPARALERREIPFVMITAIVDRRANGERVIELMTTDRSSLVVARGGVSDPNELNRTAKELGRVLKMPTELGKGAVAA
jgi:hypothetical protein